MAVIYQIRWKHVDIVICSIASTDVKYKNLVVRQCITVVSNSELQNVIPAFEDV